MKNKLFILPALCFTLIFATCKKNPTPDNNYPFFECKINGQKYIPNNCANCLSFMILEDTSLIGAANQGFKTIRFGINDSTNIQAKTYSLTNIGGMRATYKNSTTTDDYYRTQDFNPGSFTIIEINKTNKTIKGKFNFVAYHSINLNDSVIYRMDYFM
ncbi:MAG: DUF6252 family protein [Ginsengibacter sp.]